MKKSAIDTTVSSESWINGFLKLATCISNFEFARKCDRRWVGVRNAKFVRHKM